MSTTTIATGSLPVHAPPAAPLAQQAAVMLRRIGWEPSQLQQIRIYAQMPPEAKVIQMLRLRHQLMEAMRTQIRAEEPNISPDAMRARVLARLDLHRRVQALPLSR